MPNPQAKNLHLAPGATVYTRCIAEHSCPYLHREVTDPDTGTVTQLPAAAWSDHHFSLIEIAEAGGGKFATQGRTLAQAYTISPIQNGAFSYGREGSGRTTTWAVGGFQLTKQQAAAWRKSLIEESEEENS